MDIEHIKSRVANIERLKDDDECAHVLEDNLMQDFIRHVASSGHSELAAMANEVLKTEDIEFGRYCT